MTHTAYFKPNSSTFPESNIDNPVILSSDLFYPDDEPHVKIQLNDRSINTSIESPHPINQPSRSKVRKYYRINFLEYVAPFGVQMFKDNSLLRKEDTSIDEDRNTQEFAQLQTISDIKNDISDKIKSFKLLQVGWDGDRANPISPTVIKNAINLLQEIEYPPEVVSATRADTILFEYPDYTNVYLEIEVSEREFGYLYVHGDTIDDNGNPTVLLMNKYVNEWTEARRQTD